MSVGKGFTPATQAKWNEVGQQNIQKNGLTWEKILGYINQQQGGSDHEITMVEIPGIGGGKFGITYGKIGSGENAGYGPIQVAREGGNTDGPENGEFPDTMVGYGRGENGQIKPISYPIGGGWGEFLGTIATIGTLGAAGALGAGAGALGSGASAGAGALGASELGTLGATGLEAGSLGTGITAGGGGLGLTAGGTGLGFVPGAAGLAPALGVEGAITGAGAGLAAAAPYVGTVGSAISGAGLPTASAPYTGTVSESIAGAGTLNGSPLIPPGGTAPLSSVPTSAPSGTGESPANPQGATPNATTTVPEWIKKLAPIAQKLITSGAQSTTGAGSKASGYGGLGFSQTSTTPGGFAIDAAATPTNQQIASALLLQNPEQPTFNPLTYAPLNQMASALQQQQQQPEGNYYG